MPDVIRPDVAECSAGVRRSAGAGRVRAAPGPEGPFLEGRAAPRVVEAHDPQISVVARRRAVVEDLHARDARVALHRDDLARHAKGLVGALALALPQLRDLLDSLLRLLE